MTQEQLAVLLGVSRQAVTKWESEKSYPEMDKLLKLCQIFNCTLDLSCARRSYDKRANSAPEGETSHPHPQTCSTTMTAPCGFGLGKISLGVASIIFEMRSQLPFFNANRPRHQSSLFTLPENIATTLGMLFPLFRRVIAGLALIIPAGLSARSLCARTPLHRRLLYEKKTNPARAALSASNSLEASPASSRAFARSFSLVKAPKTSSG